MTKKKEIYQKNEQPKLLMSREDSESRLHERINIGNEYFQKQIRSQNEYTQLCDDVGRWNKYNHELLLRMFSSDIYAQEYSRYFAGMISMNYDWRHDVEDEKKEISEKVNRLRAILERLELIPLGTQDASSHSAHDAITLKDNKKVFIVHGHDNEVKEAVARFLEKIDLVPIILHEQANEGSTIIEKFEKNADVAFALVLLTPDDRGASSAFPDEVKDRARQNVILELGYFFGRLGRQRVCALYKSGVELPSDVSGILYVPYDGTSNWMFAVAKEFKSVGMSIDLNKLV